MKLLEVTQPQFSPELTKYLEDLGLVGNNVTLSPSGKLIVEGSVDLPSTATSIEYPFESISGFFDCASTNITSLVGAPQMVGEGFYCHSLRITSLTGAPQSVGLVFDCSSTLITSLTGAPQSVGGSFYCCDTYLTSLEHAPQQVGG